MPVRLRSHTLRAGHTVMLQQTTPTPEHPGIAADRTQRAHFQISLGFITLCLEGDMFNFNLTTMIVLVIGSDDSGKTSLVNRYIKGTFVPSNNPDINKGDPTVGLKFCRLDRHYSIQIW
eukprot:571740-Amorphochlora_amoeboformis.AAC.2